MWSRSKSILRPTRGSKNLDLTFLHPFSTFCVGNGPYNSLQWYRCWIEHQVEAQPKELFSTISQCEKSSEDYWDTFSKLWQEIAHCLTSNISTSIVGIVSHLADVGLVDTTHNWSSDYMHLTRRLIFVVIGWQTMLYQPDIGSCPPSQLAIKNQMDGYLGQSQLCSKQSDNSTKKQIYEFLLGFGMLLPPRNFSALTAPDAVAAFNELTTVAPATFNAHFLTSIGGIKIEWVDSLPCHLEFNADTNTLFMFRCPSFCLLNYLSTKTDHVAPSVLHSCAAPQGGTWQCATKGEVTQMLQETMLSYRLLFGQHKASRQQFRGQALFEDMPEMARDQFLMTLCTRKRPPDDVELPEREVYDLRRDFPVLRGRLTALILHLQRRKPTSWKDLWKDKRDSASWLTLWAVLIIGWLGILLSTLQVVLQIIQIRQGSH